MKSFWYLEMFLNFFLQKIFGKLHSVHTKSRLLFTSMSHLWISPLLLFILIPLLGVSLHGKTFKSLSTLFSTSSVLSVDKHFKSLFRLPLLKAC